MDPELRAHLEAMEQRSDAKMAAMEQRAAARDAETRAVLRTEAKATRAVAEAALKEAIAGRTEARVMHEATLDAIKTMGEGLTKHQSEQIDRQATERHQTLMEQHILPLEASAADHEQRIAALEEQAR